MPRHSSEPGSASEIRAQHRVSPNKAKQYITGDGSPAQHTTNALDAAAAGGGGGTLWGRRDRSILLSEPTFWT